MSAARQYPVVNRDGDMTLNVDDHARIRQSIPVSVGGACQCVDCLEGGGGWMECFVYP